MPNIDKIRVDNVDYDINMDIYTTTETRIGTWIDGKPLYRKTINFGNLPNNDTKYVAHNVSNISKVSLCSNNSSGIFTL